MAKRLRLTATFARACRGDPAAHYARLRRWLARAPGGWACATDTAHSVATDAEAAAARRVAGRKAAASRNCHGFPDAGWAWGILRQVKRSSPVPFVANYGAACTTFIRYGSSVKVLPSDDKIMTPTCGWPASHWTRRALLARGIAIGALDIRDEWKLGVLDSVAHYRANTQQHDGGWFRSVVALARRHLPETTTRAALALGVAVGMAPSTAKNP